ncbi:DUF2147 domain-containing protein, partial [Acinetobacter baumannii]|uniref:DUF2147 domain-containing protein n=1 Tax=Acinetobacter baumannii TaxID=470 RepID=UPI001CB843CF
LWTDDLTGNERLRCITNYLTRMRLTNAEGALEFSFKDTLDAPYTNKPILGLDIATGLKQTDNSTYTGGKILDPNTGKVYGLK